jgi:crotonobetainyl-CoA:carnitine CoA-transferase CaiB-like acyl-CoA transferase
MSQVGEPKAPRSQEGEHRPLDGIRVLDLTRALAGPFCSMILGDLGADVIKVEPMETGDMSRLWGPFDHGISTYFLSTNRNKRGLALDFRDPGASALLQRMAAQCDVVVDNFRPGTMENLGLNYEQFSARCPRLIFTSISGYGRGGPLGDQPGFDQIAQGYSGLMSVTGMPESGPTRVGVAIGDETAGMWAAMGTITALFQRQTTGLGQRVETSLLASLVGMLSVQGQRYLSVGNVPGLIGNAHPVICPYGAFATADGLLNIAPATNEMWLKLCGLLDLGDLPTNPRFHDNAARCTHRNDLQDLLESRLRQQSMAHWSRLFAVAGIPAGPINDIAGALNEPQVRHCGLVETLVHPHIGPLQMVGHPVRVEGVRTGCQHLPPPQLGEHTDRILTELGWRDAEIRQLHEAGVLHQAPAVGHADAQT